MIYKHTIPVVLSITYNMKKSKKKLVRLVCFSTLDCKYRKYRYQSKQLLNL